MRNDARIIARREKPPEKCNCIYCVYCGNSIYLFLFPAEREGDESGTRGGGMLGNNDTRFRTIKTKAIAVKFYDYESDMWTDEPRHVHVCTWTLGKFARVDGRAKPEAQSSTLATAKNNNRRSRDSRGFV